jgi:ribonuclease E
MGSHILMNVLDEQELRVGVIRDGRLESLLHERIGDGQHLGNIYKAKVANVEPSLDAAFLDLGAGKNGFIHVDELIHDKPRGTRIEQILRPGDDIVVQITKESIKDKGPNMTMYLSIPGRYLVLMHSEQAKGVSKRIEDPLVRRRLKKILDSCPPPEGFGFIVRTAAAERDEAEIKLDYEFLKRLWAEVEALSKSVRAPFCLYQEADVVVRTLRDVAGPDVQKIIIDQEKLYDEARAFAQVFMPELVNRIELHRDELPIFTFYGVEERLAHISDRKVQLPSGGTIVIEQTEALVSIDVNSAKNRESSDVEQTALMTNLEAVNTIAEQLVLRDLGGLIIIDFIDMEDRGHQRLVQLALRRALSTDKAKIQVTSLSRFGLVEMTRQRTRPSHAMVSSVQCPHCVGTGSVKTAESIEIDCMRQLRQMLHTRSVARLEIVLPQDVAIHILNARHQEISELEQRKDCKIVFSGDPSMKAREFRLVPSFHRGQRNERSGGGNEKRQSVRPSLLAPLMVEQAKAIQLAKELAAMKPADLERELAEDPISGVIRAPAPAASEAPVEVRQVVVVAPAVARASTVFEDAVVLRRLLFSPNEPVTVGAVVAATALAHAGSSSSASASASISEGPASRRSGSAGLASGGRGDRNLSRQTRGRRRH